MSVAHQTLANGEKNVAVALVDSSQTSVVDTSTVVFEDYRKMYQTLVTCAGSSLGTTNETVTKRGASGLTWITYNPSGWSKKGSLPQTIESVQLSCIGIMYITGVPFLSYDTSDFNGARTYINDANAFAREFMEGEMKYVRLFGSFLPSNQQTYQVYVVRIAPLYE